MIHIISIVIGIIIVSPTISTSQYTNNLSETSSRSALTGLAGMVNQSLAELEFTPLQSQSLELQPLLGPSAELDQIRMSPPTGGRWEEICSSFIREVLGSVSTSTEVSKSPNGQVDVADRMFGREVERTIDSLRAVASASTEFSSSIPAELRVSLQSLGSLAETIRTSWSALVGELGVGIEQKVGSRDGSTAEFTDLFTLITSFQNRVDEVAHGLASQDALTDQLRKTLGTLGQTLQQSLVKLSGREVYAFARA